MPFWWNRRRKPWWGRWKYRRRRRFNTKKRRRRRRIPRTRNRRFTRRRYKRKRKVRRKLKRITLKQWQPDSVKKCKIKGYSCIVMGAEGRQMYCYTNEASEYIQPKAPGGGGFGVEVISLKWLYQQFLAHNNIWTRSNEYTDLVRYTGCQITFYRHPYIDFIIHYDTQPPFDINKYTYPEIQPQNMLLRKHKRILLSRLSKPNGRMKLKIKIPPPKQMTTKWFFQKDFCPYGLVKLSAAAADFSYPRIGPKSQSNILTVYSLNTNFYQNSDWAAQKTTDYKNISTQVLPIYFTYKESNKGDQTFTYNPDTSGVLNKYLYSVSYDTGLFSKKVLLSYKIKAGGSPPGTTEIAGTPIITLRYNPHEDDGFGNEVYLTSILNGRYNKPSYSTDLQFNNVPLYIAFYGYYNYLQIYMKTKGLFDSHMFVVKCKAMKPLSQVTSQTYYPILDADFVFGKLPWDEYLSENIKKFWYPTAERQANIINSIVESGAFVPKLSNLSYSTWELTYHYKFFFKWGGPYTTDPKVEDPCTRNKYPVPDTMQQTLQIVDPEKNKNESILHDWDFRRGLVTETALKRMSENLPTDSSIYPDDTESPKKKRKITKELPCQKEKNKEIQECLLSLCEENTCQDQTQDIQQLIQQQQQQQHLLKKNILQLLTHLKKSQRCMELQTGLLE
nr:MAG: ORF1 [Torque teno midi virus]